MPFRVWEDLIRRRFWAGALLGPGDVGMEAPCDALLMAPVPRGAGLGRCLRAAMVEDGIAARGPTMLKFFIERVICAVDESRWNESSEG